MKYCFLIAFMFIVCVSASGQEGKDVFTMVQSKKSGEGTVKIHQDSSINHLVNKYINYCETAKGFPGFRIRIFSDSGNNARVKANNMKGKFSAAYTDYESYLVYNSPNFEIYVGDFRTKSEALKLLKALQSEYPSAFIVKALIVSPKN
ncbi:MAG: SPOR domain-containing protein [Bacteroidia bacterium]|nr:SPOR domain-containing protein [Bacteroidia bacterium]